MNMPISFSPKFRTPTDPISLFHSITDLAFST